LAATRPEEGVTGEMDARYDGGEALLDALLAAGIEVVFSSPGSEWAPVWEAIARRSTAAEAAPAYHDLWHETTAVGMATGYALVSGRPAGVLLHAGAGLLQGASAIHGAQLAGAPMVICSSESTTYGERESVDPGSQWYRNLSVVGGPHGLVSGYVKWANQVGGVEVLPGMVVRAGELAQRAPEGPVYLNVPLEVLLEPTRRRELHSPVPAGRRVSPPEEIELLARRLVGAERPVIMTESAGREPGGYEALLALAELLAIAVVEPQSAVCANFPRRHPLHQGSELGPCRDADLILLVNCRAPFYPPSNRPPDATIVVIDAVPQRPHIAYQALGADCYLEGDVALTLAALIDAVRDQGVDERVVAARHERLAEAHAKAADKLAQTEQRAAWNADAIDPPLLVQRLREIAPPGTLIVDETITHSRLLRASLNGERDSYLYVQGGLGQGLPVTLGAKYAARERPVVLAIGDGAFIYNPVIASLAASRDLGLPLLVVIFNNRQYLSMKMNHLRFYPDGAAAATGGFRGVDLGTQPELSAFAAPFGMHAESVEDPSGLAPALERGFQAVAGGTTSIVNVHLSR
jgi:thiamine pyrophosphate-dependent acetolactate synthase large subunit-like protein